jgi:hypothetical protein
VLRDQESEWHEDEVAHHKKNGRDHTPASHEIGVTADERDGRDSTQETRAPLRREMKKSHQSFRCSV